MDGSARPIAGIPYGRQLVDAITAARIVLLIFSGNANRSEHVLRELEVASDSGKIIVPFRIENVTPSGDLRYYITRVHWLDAMSPPMESRLNELVTLMQRLLGLPIMPAAAAIGTVRKTYSPLAAVAVVLATIAIALGIYFMKRPGPPAAHAIAKATPQPKRAAAAMAKPVGHAVTVVPTPAPAPTPRIVYIAQPGQTAVPYSVVPNVPKRTTAAKPHTDRTPAPRATAKPIAYATVVSTVSPTITSLAAMRAPTTVEYRTSARNFFITHTNEADWRVGIAPHVGGAWTTVGRAAIAGTAGTTLLSPNGREWLFVPDLGAAGPYAHKICFSLAGPGVCDVNKTLSIVTAY